MTSVRRVSEPESSTWLAPAPPEWDRVRLRHLGQLKTGNTPPRSHDEYYAEDGGMPWVKPANLGTTTPIIDSAEHLTPEGEDAATPVPAGAVLVGCIGSVGEVGFAGTRLATNQQITSVVFRRDIVVPRFGFYALSAAREELRSRVNTSVLAILSTTDMGDVRIPVPPRRIQQAITDFLDEKTAGIDRIVKDKKRLIGRLEEARHSLIHARATRGLAPGASPKNSEVPWVGRVPEHWDTKKLRYMAECLDRKRIPLNSSERADMQGPYPYWGANGIVDHVDDWLFDEELVLLGEDGAPFFDPHKSVARFVTGKIWVNNHAHVLRARTDTDPRFLAYALNAVDYADYIKGSTRDKLVQAEMNEIRLPAPPVAEQKKIADVLDDEGGEIDGLVEDLKEQLSSLEEYRTSLISAAVTGQIDVRASASSVV